MTTKMMPARTITFVFFTAMMVDCSTAIGAPNPSGVLQTQGVRSAGQGNFSQALGCFSAALKEHPNAPAHIYTFAVTGNLTGTEMWASGPLPQLNSIYMCVSCGSVWRQVFLPVATV